MGDSYTWTIIYLSRVNSLEIWGLELWSVTHDLRHISDWGLSLLCRNTEIENHRCVNNTEPQSTGVPDSCKPEPNASPCVWLCIPSSSREPDAGSSINVCGTELNLVSYSKQMRPLCFTKANCGPVLTHLLFALLGKLT